MVICFTKYLLGEKHQLSKIWLAAHWENKIKRSQIFDVDIERSVQDMMETEIILDLRISGHLLVGFVKIYAKKSKYLLTECSSIFYQIKVFHSGAIDLPLNKQTAKVEDVTLNDVFDNFHVESNIIDTILTTNLSHAGDITLKETTEQLTLWDDIDIVDFNVNKEETFENFDESILSIEGSLEIAKDLNLVIGKNKPVVDKQRRNSRCKKDVLTENEQAIDCIDKDVFAVKVYDSETLISVIPETALFASPEIAMNVHSESATNVIPETQGISNDNSHLPQTDELDILSNTVVDKFILKPLKTLSMSSSKGNKSKKRKLCIDYKTCFPMEVLKKNMIDPFDIMTVLDLAPATKRSMSYKQTGCVESLLSLPFLKLQSPKLLKLYKRHLNVNQTDDLELLSEEGSLECAHMLRKRSKSDIHECLAAVEEPPENLGVMDTSDSRKYTVLLDNQNDIPVLDDDLDSRLMICDPVLEDEIPNNMPVENTLITQTSSRNETQSTPKTSQEKWEYAFHNRMVQMLQHLKLLFQERSTIRFSFLVQNNKKLLVSQKFFCLLMLKKFEVVCLEQSNNFDEIYITLDENFESAFSKFCKS